MGAVVAGPKPEDDPSLADNQAEFHKLADQLFGDGTGVHSVGKGKVYAGQSLADVFKAMNLQPDFDYSNPNPDAPVLFAHRHLADADLYFIDNRSDNPATFDASFRITGKTPELWYAETGRPHLRLTGSRTDRTSVPLKLEPWGTVFVVFRENSKQPSVELSAKADNQLATVDGPWQVSFPARPWRAGIDHSRQTDFVER